MRAFSSHTLFQGQISNRLFFTQDIVQFRESTDIDPKMCNWVLQLPLLALICIFVRYWLNNFCKITSLVMTVCTPIALLKAISCTQLSRLAQHPPWNCPCEACCPLLHLVRSSSFESGVFLTCFWSHFHCITKCTV